MKMNTPQSKIEEMARRFTDELIAVARDELVQMLGGGNGVASASKATKTRAAASTGRKPSSRRKGAKRDPKALEALQAKVLTFIKGHPNLRVEQINRELGMETKELQLPLRKLLAAKEIKATGKRRATKYSVPGSKK